MITDEKYVSLITSEHDQRPKFVAMVRAVAASYVEDYNLMKSYTSLFDIDEAIGQQLDVVGQWVGVSRFVSVKLDSVYFSFDVAGLGLDEGKWYSPYNPLYTTVRLDDEPYRTLLRAKIANNQWDGTIPGAYAVWETLFADTGIGLLIQDLSNMHMVVAFTGPVPDEITLSLVAGGYLDLRPAGVQIDAYLTPTVTDTAYFGFDVENASIAGFDHGAWGKVSFPDTDQPNLSRPTFGLDKDNDEVAGFDDGVWNIST